MRLRALFLPIALIAVASAAAPAHPLHTTLTEVTQGRGDMTIWVRAFEDDFARGVAAHRAPPGADPTLAYLGASVGVWDREGRRVRLTACGTKASGDLRWFCMRAPAPRGVSGMRILVSLQFSVYDDQVNVLQADVAGRRGSLLFVPGDGAKRLP